ncbi:TIGR00730 family Rossman fold protein [candidate division KSB3 bacterium]|uniref:Cytokinin riboside 5'-monophosphate phosphoribohydrolase n=1 Tax=candidate division KSB3 bacterium TaxID=2044937 RepID=A0A9D5JZ13_9BACT|nr:TIGR00730 family Rossman fold protein [candidate division KSB3 bacterium]MBD3326882.1 TIGR00730 family Rossman fold protein [candidate division KSB3 bacterium]
MKRLCVFCGSSPGLKPAYRQAARDLGQLLANRQIGLVYGGGNVGMMGEIARVASEAGGEVIGVIPKALAEKEVAFTDLTDLRVVESMHERKALMAQLSDGFIALPGGLGTLEEFFEVLTWAQLNIHRKPCGLLNICRYYDKLIGFVDYAVEQGFITTEHRSLLLIDAQPDGLLRQFEHYQPIDVDKAAWALQLDNT